MLPNVKIALPNPTLLDASTFGEGECQCRWFPTGVKNRHALHISCSTAHAIIENVLITGYSRYRK